MARMEAIFSFAEARATDRLPTTAFIVGVLVDAASCWALPETIWPRRALVR